MLTNAKTMLLCGAVIATLAVSQGFSATLHVDPNDETAFQTIQKAIDSARNFDTVVVHAGTYNESVNFHGKAITLRSLDPNDSDTVAGTIIDGNGADAVVAFRQGETEYSSLEGFTVQNGIVGIECASLSTRPKIKCCVIRSNETGVTGGTLSLTDSAVEWNDSDGIRDCSGETYACDISDNGGRGVHITSGSLGLRGCTISQNGKAEEAPGIYVWGGTLTLRNCIVSGNAASGISRPPSGYYPPAAHITISHSTIVGNGDWGYHATASAFITFENNIIAFNGLGGILQWHSGPAMSSALRYNDFFGNGGEDWTGAIYVNDHSSQENPWFVASGYFDPDIADPNAEWVEGDYHLMSTVGTWDPASQDWVQYLVDSPCLDKGDPDAPFLEEPYPNGGRLNLGAYGNTPEASMSEPGVRCTGYPEMDFNHDCKVDQADLDIFLEHWLECNLDDPDACWPDGPAPEPQVQPQP